MGKGKFRMIYYPTPKAMTEFDYQADSTLAKSKKFPKYAPFYMCGGNEWQRWLVYTGMDAEAQMGVSRKGLYTDFA
ncbi:MAG: hypothetical protein A3G33_07705 [Omnitrophica bacterium RIFCSPLOWO2_12_FULL_44_17]|uniref:Uncharacterized protein n=1 Tax=Candidatus Danuiimicrobium aquiferis TaxID=1801832 RepID=A0A1G1L1U4_9BACT|nr:MAG: hypothetical protein A3B72_02260 [Omnitrophica bacterium RIFCSPHIGHO2_02_FULL_45_28]OGW88888.1 MAG: hypothetical protein A3E74_10230 [Omnitrophica bacterium RIFCSPHIGHO2_12_FULL_44_12]OGW99111.1 MAG: hypothetical protein A3G33_07705 [Omnitrophica bacterium RIFCSPLOWO2_12_FULL_44_17]OGX02606.1 MAG: hypothetical protein A3J12_01940 [Omnitrophica bacterium RIFCSPLOWO2_02_FULL_44_11]